MIPDSLLQTLISQLVDAISCARAGDWSVGYDALLDGLHHA
jgi:hypothetical protein